MDAAARIGQFIRENFLVSPTEGLVDDTSLIATGIVDSTGMLEVINFLEAEFGIAIQDHETVPENLETIHRMAGFVERKRDARAA